MLGDAVPLPSAIRWFSRREMMEFICKKWDLLVMMFTSQEAADLIDSACVLFPRVKAALTDADSPLLRLYLTVIQESTRPLNALCYTVEGDQACLPLCHIAGFNVQQVMSGCTPRRGGKLGRTGLGHVWQK